MMGIETMSGHSTNDLNVANRLGELSGQMAAMNERMANMEKKIDGVVGYTNRWKGATALLLGAAMLVGYLSNVLHGVIWPKA